MGHDTAEEVAIGFRCEDLILRGHWHRPCCNSTRGLVMYHGAGGYSVGPRRLFVDFARHAASQGWHVLRFDFRGHGHSDGISPQRRLDEMVRDGVAALRMLRERAGIETMAVVGICSGAAVALAVAQHERVDKLALWSLEPPALNLTPSGVARGVGQRLSNYLTRLRSRAGWSRLLSGEVDLRGVLTVLAHPLAQYWRQADSKPPQSPDDSRLEPRGVVAGRSADVPILLVFARRDSEAVESSKVHEKELRAHRRPHKTVWIEETDHNFFSVTARKQLCAETLHFLDESLPVAGWGLQTNPNPSVRPDE